MSRLKWQAVVAGVGGQGVLFVSRALASAVEPVAGAILISEVHGMAQRGGAVVSHLKAGPFSGPLVSFGQADLLLALDPGEAVRNLTYLAPKGHLVVNAPDLEFLSPKARKALASFGAQVLTVPAAELAGRAGTAKGANVVLLGALCGLDLLPIGAAEVEAALGEMFPEAKMAPNREALTKGLELAQKT